MKKAQALQVLCALFETESLGVADDQAVEKILNQGFIRACTVADPDLPTQGYVAPWNIHESPSTQQARGKWARFFREMADGIEGMEEPKP